jgi:hypothetical protein
MALFVAEVGEQSLLGKLLYGAGGPITAGSGSSGNTVTIVTTDPHGLVTGDRVYISDCGVATINNNGPYVITTSGGSTFTFTYTGIGTNTITAGFWNLAEVENGILHLFKTSHVMSETDVAGSFTEADFTAASGGSYTSKTLSARLSTTLAWSLPANVGGGGTGAWAPQNTYNVAESTYPQQTWTWGTNTPSPSNETIYGYYVTGGNTTKLWWAENFSVAKALSPGDTLQLVPRFGLSHT